MPFLSSNRLYLRPFQQGDAKRLLALDSNPNVMRYIGPTQNDLTHHEKVVTRIIQDYNKNDGFGLWSAHEKNSHEFVGWFALKPLPDRPEIEIGYRLLEEKWGNGYATEMGKTLLEYGFNHLQLNQINAIVKPDNEASKKVLEKIGLIYLNNYMYLGKHDVAFYELKKQDYKQLSLTNHL